MAAFKRQEESKYLHEYDLVDSKWILGASDDSADDGLDGLDVLNKYENYDEYIMCVDDPSIRKWITLSIIQWRKKLREDNKSALNGIYWDVFSDFIFFMFDKTVFDMAKLLNQSKLFHYSTEQIYKSLATTPFGLRKVRHPKAEWMFLLCCQFRISFDILSKGKGVFYSIENNKNKEKLEKIIEQSFTINSIVDYFKNAMNINLLENDNVKMDENFKKAQDIDLLKMITNITGISSNEFEAEEIEVSPEFEFLDCNTNSFLCFLLENYRQFS